MVLIQCVFYEMFIGDFEKAALGIQILLRVVSVLLSVSGIWQEIAVDETNTVKSLKH